MAAKLCNVCNIRRVYTGNKGTEIAPVASEMCNYCFEEGGMENQHSDHDHEAIAEEVADAEAQGVDLADILSKHAIEELGFMAGCWICHPELNLAQKTTGMTGTVKRTQGARRPQLNHKGHHHPQTPAARRACKAAFWKRAEELKLPVAEVAEAMAAWDTHLDGYGKPVAAPKGGWAGVAPRGPKGGVINQLKASKPKGTSLGRAERAHAKAAGLIK